jgi:hypothetical protein
MHAKAVFARVLISGCYAPRLSMVIGTTPSSGPLHPEHILSPGRRADMEDHLPPMWLVPRRQRMDLHFEV